MRANINFHFNSESTLDAPVCTTDKVVLVGAAKDENVEIICNINADPPAK
jgi:hypothetical protein